MFAYSYGSDQDIAVSISVLDWELVIVASASLRKLLPGQVGGNARIHSGSATPYM